MAITETVTSVLLVSSITGFFGSFLIELIKNTLKWENKKAFNLAFAVSLGLSVLASWLVGDFAQGLVVSLVTIFTTATLTYNWFVSKIKEIYGNTGTSV